MGYRKRFYTVGLRFNRERKIPDRMSAVHQLQRQPVQTAAGQNKPKDSRRAFIQEDNIDKLSDTPN